MTCVQAVTPVRRSARKSPGRRAAKDLLEANGYAFSPNPALVETPDNAVIPSRIPFHPEIPARKSMLGLVPPAEWLAVAPKACQPCKDRHWRACIPRTDIRRVVADYLIVRCRTAVVQEVLEG